MLNENLIKIQKVTSAVVTSKQPGSGIDTKDSSAANASRFDVNPSKQRRLRRQRRQLRYGHTSVGGWTLKTW
jgi:hypothetical protein